MPQTGDIGERQALPFIKQLHSLQLYDNFTPDAIPARRTAIRRKKNYFLALPVFSASLKLLSNLLYLSQRSGGKEKKHRKNEIEMETF